MDKTSDADIRWVDSTTSAYPERIEDLQTQVDYLDQQIRHYRAANENERIKHATEIANLHLEIDARADAVSREHFEQSQELHDSYRALLSERELQYENELARVSAEIAKVRDAERARHSEHTREIEKRHASQEDAHYRRRLNEVSEQHQRETHDLKTELKQARITLERLQTQLEKVTARADASEKAAGEHQVRARALEQRLAQQAEATTGAYTARIKDLERRAQAAESHLAEERARSAATISEILGKSASLAAEVDQSRSDFDDDRERLELATAIAEQHAKEQYDELLRAADDRALEGLNREAELEARIAELRRQLESQDR